MNLNPLQADWIIRMYDRDNPGKLKELNKLISTEVVAQTKWSDVLIGKGLTNWLRQRVPEYMRDRVKGHLNGD